MGKKHASRNFFSRTEEGFKVQLLILVALSAIVIVVYLIIDSKIEDGKHREYTIVDEIRLINQVESISIEDDNITIKGYAFMSDRSSSDDLITVFLRNVVKEEEVWLDMKQIDRPEVNAYFAGEFDYNNTGFIASTDSKKIDDKEVYEIIINIDYVKEKEETSKDIRRTVSTNSYISDGELYTYNPIEFDKPYMNIESELIREVFANGRLCLYQKEEGLYIYQYNNKLYWIANENFNFEEDGSTYILYRLYTSRPDMLPEDRIEAGMDNPHFYFEESEYIEENTAPYRVAIRDIPNGYPITYIETGVHDTVNDKAIWRKVFHINSIFN